MEGLARVTGGGGKNKVKESVVTWGRKRSGSKHGVFSALLGTTTEAFKTQMEKGSY